MQYLVFLEAGLLIYHLTLYTPHNLIRKFVLIYHEKPLGGLFILFSLQIKQHNAKNNNSTANECTCIWNFFYQYEVENG